MGSTLFSKRYTPKHSSFRKKRVKTFKTEESAKAYAEKNGIKNFKIVPTTYETGKLKIVKQ
jgi:hypothetical protein